MFGFGAVPAICLAVAMIFVPHAPRWLVQRGHDDEARAVLAHSRADDEIDDEIDGIKEAAQAQHAFRFRQLFGPRLRMVVLVGRHGHVPADSGHQHGDLLPAPLS